MGGNTRKSDFPKGINGGKLIEMVKPTLIVTIKGKLDDFNEKNVQEIRIRKNNYYYLLIKLI